MKESTSLKVREYFLNGLPTLIGSKDPAFPDHFKYLIQKDEFDIPLIINYLEENKGVLKITIRNSADQYINSKYALKKLYNFATNE
jgi:hypothetical protein